MARKKARYNWETMVNIIRPRIMSKAVADLASVKPRASAWHGVEYLAAGIAEHAAVAAIARGNDRFQLRERGRDRVTSPSSTRRTVRV